MITQLKFHNFRILQDATLPLGRVTVIIGPNGSGKSTALQAFKLFTQGKNFQLSQWGPIQRGESETKVSITVKSADPDANYELAYPAVDPSLLSMMRTGNLAFYQMSQSEVFAFDSAEVCKSSPLEKTLKVNDNGSNLPSVLTTLQDQFPERFDALNEDLRGWMPEFDRILLDTTGKNERSFLLRTAIGRHAISAPQLSSGNLIAIALLTLSHLPEPPTIIGLEEIDRGIHPRLLRDVQDAVNRLAYPENYGDTRKPVQVVMTTHSPYFVDLFRDTPEDIVIAEKNGLSASFHRLVDMPNAEEILRDAHLGEAWFTGVLGGTPTGR